MIDKEQYINQAEARFTSFYRRKKGVRSSIFRAIVGEIWELEKTYADLLEKTSLDGATGQQMDNNGAVHGISRPVINGSPADDVRYKTLQTAQIAINNTNALFDEIYSVWSLLTAQGDGSQPNPDVELFDTNFGAIILEYRGEILPELESLIFEKMTSILKANVRIASVVKLPDIEDVTLRISSETVSYVGLDAGQLAE